MADIKPDESIIKRIQHLLNLGNKATNEHEAALAMSKAQELLAKYNLDMAVIEATAVEGGVEPVKEKRERTKIDRSAMYKWQRDLCKAICEANFCWYWTVDGLEDEERVSNGRSYRHKVKRHLILGKESNVIAVTYMYGWLADTIESLLPYTGSLRNSKSAISWKEGCAERLAERIKEKAYRMQHPTEQAPSAQSTGLMIRSLVKSEYAANYDALHGDGAYARYEASLERWKAESELRSKAAAEAEAATPKKELTEAEKKKQQKEQEKQEKQNKRWWERFTKQQQRERDKKDMTAYNAGKRAAEQISLADKLEAK